MRENIKKHIEQNKLFSKNEPIIVALSGGVDSMVLFDIIYSYNKNVIIAHVNHNKREESIKEYEFIKEMAKKLKVPFEGHSIQGLSSNNFHNDSRMIRYEFFKAVAQKYSSQKIAVAHHLDDQVETVLMRIVRGTSFSGYTGIKEIRYDRNVQIIRPLMHVSKEDILNYAEENKITFFEDKSNYEDVYTRNRFRNNIIPLLKQENPNLNEKIIQLAEYIDSADEILEEKKTEFLKSFSIYNNVHLSEFNKLNKIVKIKVIKHLVNNATKNTVEVSYDQYKAIIELCTNSTPNQSISLSDNYNFIKEYEVIYIAKQEEIMPLNIKITKEGEYFVSDNKSYIISSDNLVHNYRNYFEVCYNELVFPLFIRQRKTGDKMQLKIGTKKIKDIFIDQKIPKSLRDRLLLISDSNQVLWIPKIKKSHQDKSKNKKLYIYEVE